MALSAAQLVTLGAYITADPVLNAHPKNTIGADAISVAMNAAPAVAFFVYKTNTPVIDLLEQITWANFTPQDLPPVAAVPTAPTVAETYALDLWRSRSLQCQGKQFNIQTLLSGRNELNTAKQKIRDGIQDALTAIPSGLAGASKAGGWTNVQTILYRPSILLEKVMATGTGTTLAPATMGYEGQIGGEEIRVGLGWPNV